MVLLPKVVDGELKDGFEEYTPIEREISLERDSSVDIFDFRNTYAAAPIVANSDPKVLGSRIITSESIDWKATAKRLKTYFDLGIGTAFPMDTAQRGAEITEWKIVEDLIKLNIEVAKSYEQGERAICGAGVELVDDPKNCSLDEVIESYVHQVNFIRREGGTPIIFPNNILPEKFPDQRRYENFIHGVMRGTSGDVYLHWLGKAFNAKMERYWGHSNIEDAADKVVHPLMEQYSGRIKGIKLSTLNQKFEEDFRRKIRKNGQIVLTGDDYNFAPLIAGTDKEDFSHALLGIFGGTAHVAAKALEYLKNGNRQAYDSLMEPLQTLSLHIFKTPTQHYKAGITFLAYLNGDQDHFKMVGGAEDRRDVAHYVELFKLADKASVLKDTQEAYARFKRLEMF